MNTIEAISERRSIRKFVNEEIENDILKKIINAGMMAPSPKNIQPWKYIVLTGKSKNELIQVITKGIQNFKQSFKVLIDSLNFLSSVEDTLKIIKEAPVIIIVINNENKLKFRHTTVKKFVEIANIQATGASIQNMLLAAFEYGIGSLWINNIFYFHSEISEWLQTDRQIIAAIALGYPAEKPKPLKRKNMDAVAEWKN